MNWEATLLNVRNRLEGFGISVDETRNPPCSEQEIENAESAMGRALPTDVRSTLLEFSNGFSFWWPGDGARLGGFEFPNLKWIANLCCACADFARSLDREALSGVDDADLLIDAMIHKWIPVFDIGNGDIFCVDVETACLVYLDHDWFDARSGRNGILLANFLSEFYQEWARLCFVWPRPFYWPSLAGPHGMEWSLERFDQRYRMNPPTP